MHHKINPKLLIPRGQSVALPHGGLPEIFSLHLQKLIAETGGAKGPIGLQFIAQPDKETTQYHVAKMDPLVEDDHEVAPGLVYKYRGKKNKTGEIVYYGRALWTITRYCSSYCRFCTRGREVGYMGATQLNSKAAMADKAYLSDADLVKVNQYLDQHTEINEIIVSGGDPLTTPQDYLTKIISLLAQRQREHKLDIVRIHTRLPIQNPDGIRDWHFSLIKQLINPYVLVHINHPAELTKEVLVIIKKFRHKSKAVVMSQTVLLRGVNDRVEVLINLFNTLAKNGIVPYYLHQNDAVSWAPHFTVPLPQAIKLWSQVRPKLSGIAATAKFVIDVPGGHGKVPLPEGGAWQVDFEKGFVDFKGKKFNL